jgi:hypothetical protein
MKGSCKDESEYSAKNQRFLNSVKPTEFEKKLEFEEKLERKLNHDKYVVGIQGVDGGYFVRDPRDRC